MKIVKVLTFQDTIVEVPSNQAELDFLHHSQKPVVQESSSEELISKLTEIKQKKIRLSEDNSFEWACIWRDKELDLIADFFNINQRFYTKTSFAIEDIEYYLFSGFKGAK